MGSLFKKTVTRPLPPDAEIIIRQGERLARWRDGKGKLRTAPVTTGQNGAARIRDESGTYVGRYRDGNGLVVGGEIRGGKSGVSWGGEIRCQFIILARKDEPTPDYARKSRTAP